MRFEHSDPNYPGAILPSDKRKPIDMVPGSIDFSFSDKNNGRSRYSDGEFGVFYAAPIKETCAKEVGYHIMELNKAFLKRDIPVFGNYLLIKVTLQGRGRNYFLKDNDLKKLCIDPTTGYDICNDIGREAFEKADIERTKFIIVPSARHKDMKCVPVIKANAIAEILCAHKLTFLADTYSTKFQVRSPKGNHTLNIESWFS